MVTVVIEGEVIPASRATSAHLATLRFSANVSRVLYVPTSTESTDKSILRIHFLAMSCDPVGTVEIAQRLKVTRSAVDAWRMRRSNVTFPAPTWTVGGRPAWEWADVEAWAREHRKGPFTADP